MNQNDRKGFQLIQNQPKRNKTHRKASKSTKMRQNSPRFREIHQSEAKRSETVGDPVVDLPSGEIHSRGRRVWIN